MSQSKAGTRLQAISLLPLALAAAVLGLAWLQWNNTLVRNGRWTPTKITVGKQLLGAQSFWEGRQALAGGALGLSAWHGFQEVLTADAMDVESFSFGFYLSKRSYLTAMIYDETGEAFSGVRVSLNRTFPNAVLEGTGEGEFIQVEPLSPPMKSGVGQHLRLVLGGSHCRVSLDGVDVGRVALPGPGPYRVGFRGGWSGAYVDDVVITTTTGTVRESFGPFRRAWVVLPILALFAFVLGLALHRLISRVRRVPSQTLAAYFAMMGTTLLIMAGLLWGAAFHLTRAPHYPESSPRLAEREQETRRRHLKTRRKEVRRDHGQNPTEDATRIFFLGTSQTWGSGARNESETIPATVEALLNSSFDHRRFETINGGVSSVTSPMLARAWTKHWIDLEPDILVVNLSNNDRDSTVFANAIERIVESAIERDVQVVLVQEPNTPERQDRSLIANHRVLFQAGQKYGVPVIPMHNDLKSKIGTGFLWWDKVHLTSYGQRLFAERLVEELEESYLAGR